LEQTFNHSFVGHLEEKKVLIQNHQVDLQTPTGIMRCYVYHPQDTAETAGKKFPAIILYSEIFQQTSPIRRSAQIMAGHGFIVIVPEVPRIKSNWHCVGL
jgi:carboxymethylenebutenolidase